MTPEEIRKTETENTSQMEKAYTEVAEGRADANEETDADGRPVMVIRDKQGNELFRQPLPTPEEHKKLIAEHPDLQAKEEARDLQNKSRMN